MSRLLITYAPIQPLYATLNKVSREDSVKSFNTTELESYIKIQNLMPLSKQSRS